MPDKKQHTRSISSEERAWFQRALLSWYREHGRDLPWRRTSDPYHILVSECMLQQTQVDRVIPKYYAFLKAFPDIRALAEAEQGDVLREWAGLGYNSRAMRLHQLAKVVLERYEGRMPHEIEILRSLPGIGAYTAGAVRTFGYRLPSAFFDINISRILQRVFDGPEKTPGKEYDAMINTFAEMLAPTDADAYDYHQSLMDIGARFCTARKALCAECPLATQCRTKFALEAEPLLLKELHQKKAATSKKKEPFHLSNRYLRGRVIDLLRTYPEGKSERELYALLQEKVPLLERLPHALQALVSERLIREEHGVYRL